MLKHQPCCRAILAEKQNKKIIHKNPMSVPLPLRSQGWGSPPLCKMARPPMVVPWVRCFGAGAVGFPPGAIVLSHRTPSPAGEGSPAPTGSAWVLAFPW